MKSERGMITLMTVFSGLAALMCLLVGLQLLSLESRIAQAAADGIQIADTPFVRWRAEVHTGAVMSLGAGALVFLFGLRNHTTARRPAAGPAATPGSDPAALDPESLSIRIFEVDAADRSVEITGGDEAAPPSRGERPRFVWHPLDDRDEEPRPGRPDPADPTETIVQSIREAAPSGRGRTPYPGAAGNRRKSFLRRLFGR